MEQKKTEHGAKKWLKILTLSLLCAGLPSGTALAAKGIYDSCFPRYEKKELYAIYGEFDYRRVEEKLRRVLFQFPSEKVMLQGYYYPCDGAKGMVVVCHGMHAGADDYIPFIGYFVSHGYAVFTYDCKGTYASAGDSTVGMCTPLVDLDHALRYISNDPTLSKFPLFLFGHSWGGYAVMSVLPLHKSIKACAAIAPFNDGYTLIAEKGEQYAGPFFGVVKEGLPAKFLSIYQKFLFGKYTQLNAVKGINSTDIPVFIAHGKRDRVISYYGQSVHSHRHEIRDENVIYYEGTGVRSGHNTILHSEEAVLYQEQVKNDLKALKKAKGRDLTEEELVAFCDGVDHALYSAVNQEMMDEIISMFDRTLD